MKLKYMGTVALSLIFLIVSLPFISAEELNLVTDNNGNLITGDSFYREYNELNQLVRIRQGNTSSGAILEEFIWHPTEERILVKDVFSNGVLNYSVYYVNQNYIHIENSSGNYSEKYVYQDGNLVAQVTTDGQKQFIHNDHLGSSSLITDINGNVVENTFYSPKGEILSGGEVGKYTFTGKEFSKVTQDYDFLARRYRPDLGTFLQCDTRIQYAYDPQLLNCYSYVRNNPLKFLDPDGKEVRLNGRALSYSDRGNHWYLEINPDNPEDFAGTEYAESFTLGGQYNKADGTLVIEKNEARDYTAKGLKESYVVPTPEGMTDTGFINEIIGLYEDYRDFDQKEDYALTAIGGYNSNVAATSLLVGVGTSRSFFSGVNARGLDTGLGKVSSSIAGYHYGARITINYNQGQVSGGTFGNIQLSAGFANKLLQIGKSGGSNKPSSPGKETSCRLNCAAIQKLRPSPKKSK